MDRRFFYKLVVSGFCVGILPKWINLVFWQNWIQSKLALGLGSPPISMSFPL